MTEWQTDPQTGLRVGAALIASFLLVIGGLLASAMAHPLNVWTFVASLGVIFCLVAVGMLIYWIGGLVRSTYVVDRNQLIIAWGPNEQVIPTAQIEQVFLGSELEGRVRFRGIRWPGYWMGYGEIEGLGPVLFYATQPPRSQVFVVTEGLVYGISPEEQEGFVHTLRSRLQMGPTQIVEPASRGPVFLQWRFWRDRLAQGMLLGGMLAVVALFGLLSVRYPSLPRLLPLHFDAEGNPDRLGPQAQIFFIPFIGLLVMAVNGGVGGALYRREPLFAYLLWIGALLVQGLLWAAVLGILAAV